MRAIRRQDWYELYYVVQYDNNNMYLVFINIIIYKYTRNAAHYRCHGGGGAIFIIQSSPRL